MFGRVAAGGRQETRLLHQPLQAGVQKTLCICIAGGLHFQTWHLRNIKLPDAILVPFLAETLLSEEVRHLAKASGHCTY